MLKTCVGCEKEFNARRSVRKYCSVACHVTQQKADAELRCPRERLSKNCKLVFSAREPSAIFCGHKCSATFGNTGRKHSQATKDAIRKKNTENGTLLGSGGSNDEHAIKAREAFQQHCRMRRVKKACPHCKTEFSDRPKSLKKYCSMRCAKLYMGGVRENSGRSKSGYYEGIFCQSSYEFAFVFVSLANGIAIRRNNEFFKYISSDGKERKYYPDYITEIGTYIEIKGWRTKNDDCKFATFQGSLEVYDGDRMEHILQEAERLTGVKRKYFFRLYGARDNDIYTGETARCGFCKEEFQCKRRGISKNVFCSRSCAGKNVGTKEVAPVENFAISSPE